MSDLNLSPYHLIVLKLICVAINRLNFKLFQLAQFQKAKQIPLNNEGEFAVISTLH